MIVLDASAALEVLLRTPRAAVAERRLFAVDETMHAPHLIDLEVAQGLRRYVNAGAMTAAQGGAAMDVWLDFPLRRYPHDPLVPRVWTLRATLTAYDAAYIALAEALDCALVTCDARIARAPGHRALVEVLA